MPQHHEIVSLETDRQFRAAVDSHTIIHEPMPMWEELHHELRSGRWMASIGRSSRGTAPSP
jgi:hypothetical protein